MRVWQAAVWWAAAPVMVTATHEAGHAVMSLMLGFEVTDITVSWLGGGSVTSVLDGAPMWRQAMVSLAGLAVNLVLGTLALVAQRRLRSAPSRAAVIAFGAASTLGALFYVTTGLLSSFGDPMMVPWLWREHTGAAMPPWALRAMCFGAAVVALPVARVSGLALAQCLGSARHAVSAALPLPVLLALHLALVPPPDGPWRAWLTPKSEVAEQLLERLAREQPELSGPERFQRVAEQLRALRAAGAVDERQRPSAGAVTLFTMMGLAFAAGAFRASARSAASCRRSPSALPPRGCTRPAGS